LTIEKAIEESPKRKLKGMRRQFSKNPRFPLGLRLGLPERRSEAFFQSSIT
jgi:hypothetical protein